MTLNEMKEQPLVSLLEKMDMADIKVHSCPGGDICAIEIKYIPRTNEGGTHK